MEILYFYAGKQIATAPDPSASPVLAMLASPRPSRGLATKGTPPVTTRLRLAHVQGGMWGT